MAKLFDVMINAASITGELRHGVMRSSVTGSGFVDANRVESQDAFVGGTLFMPSKNKTFLVTAFDQDTTKVTFSPSVTPAPVVGDKYIITAIDRDSLVDMVNNALLTMGRYIAKAEVVVPVIAGSDGNVIQLPTTISDIVDIEEYSGNSLYNSHAGWEEVPDDTGEYTLIHTRHGFYTAAILGSVADRTYRVTYLRAHPQVYDDADVIQAPYHAARIAYEAAVSYYLQRLAIKGNADDKETILMQTLQLQLQQMRAAYPVRHKQKAYKIARF